MTSHFDYDVIVVGSGFGGSVSALRLAEKGWKVAVLEMGRRLTKEDFTKAATRQTALAWMPALGMKGFFAQEVFQHVAILRGTGVGVSLICPAQVNTGYFERNDADMGWYPRISSLFPVLEPETVAAVVVRAIRENRREVIFPSLLWLSVVLFRKAPRFSIGLFRLLRLWGPSIQVPSRQP